MGKRTEANKAKLIALLNKSEDSLIGRILEYAERQDYTKYTSTLFEAWRISIVELTKSLINALNTYDNIPELTPDEDFTKDPCAKFGILEAQLHRKRGIELKMFLGLFKYYHQVYQDLIEDSSFTPNQKDWSSLFTRRFFNRVELGFISEWTGKSMDDKFGELQDSNRKITNEKNLYLATFESVSSPVILYDESGEIVNLNYAASSLFSAKEKPGGKYYSEKTGEDIAGWIKDEVDSFIKENQDEMWFEKAIPFDEEHCCFDIRLSRMLDVSKKFLGILAIFNEITERKKIEEELQSSKDMLNVILDTIPVAVFWKDKDLNYLGGNKLFAKEAHLNSASEIIGKSDFDIVPKKDAEKYRADDQIVLDSGEPKLNYEEHITQPDGSKSWIKSSKIPLSDPYGNVIGMLGTFEDISEKKKAEVKIRESEANYRNLFENSPVSISELDYSEVRKTLDKIKKRRVKDIRKYFEDHPDKLKDCVDSVIILRYNESTRILHRIPEGYESKIKFSDVFTEETYDVFLDGIITLLNGTKVFRQEATRRTLTGQKMWGIITTSVARGYEESWGKIIISQVDITERKWAEEALKWSQKNLEDAQRIAHLGSWEMDIATSTYFWSDEIFRICGMEPGSIKPTLEARNKLIHPDDRERATNDLNKALNTGEPYKTEVRIVRPDGSIRHILSQGAVVYGEKRKPVKIVGSFLDITERKIAEEELKKYSDAQVELLREVNHRVKNNISAIIGMLNKEVDRAEEEGLTSYLPVLNDLVQRVRGLSTVHTMLSATGWRPLELAELCKQVIEGALQSVPLTKKVSYKINKTRLKVTSSQAHHLTLVINELATNIVKHALDGKDKANMKVSFKDNKESFTVIFKDDGPGYPEEMLKGDLSRANIGFDLINGIVRKSLQGSVELSNDNGAITKLNIKR